MSPDCQTGTFDLHSCSRASVVHTAMSNSQPNSCSSHEEPQAGFSRFGPPYGGYYFEEYHPMAPAMRHVNPGARSRHLQLGFLAQQTVAAVWTGKARTGTPFCCSQQCLGMCHYWRNKKRNKFPMDRATILCTNWFVEGKFGACWKRTQCRGLAKNIGWGQQGWCEEKREAVQGQAAQSENAVH